MNEFDLDVFVAIAKIRSDGKGPYSEFIFKYINSTNKYENVILNFTNEGILTLLDDELITYKKRSGEDSLNLTEKTWILLQLPKTHPSSVEIQEVPKLTIETLLI